MAGIAPGLHARKDAISWWTSKSLGVSVAVAGPATKDQSRARSERVKAPPKYCIKRSPD